MSFATLVVVLDQSPATNGLGDVQVPATLPATEPTAIQLRAAKSRPTAEHLLTFKAGDRLLVSGELGLADDGNTPILWVHVLCVATAEQYLNEVMLIGRLTGAIRDSGTGKSACRTLVTNSYVAKGPDGEGEEISTYYQIRGFGRRRDRLLQAPKGQALCVLGTLCALTNKKGERYCEVRIRSMRVLSRGTSSSGGVQQAPAGANASGYDSAAYTDEPMPAYWGDSA